MNMRRFILWTAVILSLGVFIYFTSWRVIVLFPLPYSQPILVPRKANATEVNDMIAQTRISYYILRWGIIPVYSSDRGDLMPFHRDFLSLISILSPILSWLIVRRGKEDGRKDDPFKIIFS